MEIRQRGFWIRVDEAARGASPSCLSLLLVVLTAAPAGLPAQSGLMPALGFASVYFWTLYRPSLMPPVMVFALGMLGDLLAAAPLGVTPVLLLLLHGSVLTQRRVLTRQSFLLVWLGFALFAAMIASLGWALRSLLSFQILPSDPALFELAVTVALYPLLSLLFVRVERTLERTR